MDVSSAGRQLTWLLAIGGAVLLFFDTGARVLATNDEARFPVMARDILATGRWFLPEIGGVPGTRRDAREGRGGRAAHLRPARRSGTAGHRR